MAAVNYRISNTNDILDLTTRFFNALAAMKMAKRLKKKIDYSAYSVSFCGTASCVVLIFRTKVVGGVFLAWLFFFWFLSIYIYI